MERARGENVTMGAQVKSQTAGEIKKQEAELAKLNEELRLDLLQSGVDIAGIADPTPISDATGAAISLYRGDIIGAGLSLISVIPYAGDAFGKTAKGARLAKKISSLKKMIANKVEIISNAKSSIRKNAAKKIRAMKKREAANKAALNKTKQSCPKNVNQFGTQSPVDGHNGRWLGNRGDSHWMPAPTTDTGKKILQTTNGKPVVFRDGYPDFSPHAQHRVEIEMTGKNTKDFKAANEAMRKKLNNPDWEQPEGMTWHHNEDGVTMELVPTSLHESVPHSGGASIARDPEY